jgi:hypothetical protein
VSEHQFEKPADPRRPLDPKDPPPIGWDQMEAKDYRSRLFGSGNSLINSLDGWEKRELARHRKRDESAES